MIFSPKHKTKGRQNGTGNETSVPVLLSYRNFTKIRKLKLFTEFDENLWAGLVDSMTVYSKDRIVFTLTGGMEIEV